MKILYIITQADGGGAQKYVLALARHFKGAIAAGSEAVELFNDAKTAGLAVYPLKQLKRDIRPWHDLLAFWEIRRLIKNVRPDLVHLNSTKAGFLGSLAAARLKAKVIFTAHGFQFLEPMNPTAKIFPLALEKIAGWFRDYIIAVSDFDQKAAVKNRLIDQNKISTIHNGLKKVDFFPREEAKRALNVPADKFSFGTIANFYKTKGLDGLVDAMAILDDEIKGRCLFVIIGAGPEISNIKYQISNAGVVCNFILPGNVPAAAEYLKAFDAFVLPSRKEGLPFALLEALQAGLPIIATQVGGVPETLGDAGLQVPPGNPRALAEAIATLINNPHLAKQLAQRAEERSKLFSEEKMLNSTQQVYESLLS